MSYLLEQPQVVEPKVEIGAIVWDRPLEGGFYRGNIIDLSETSVQVDFHDFILEYGLRDIAVTVDPEIAWMGPVLVPLTEGKCLATFNS